MTPADPPSSPPPDDLAGHPDLDTLADLDAGLLESPAAARAGQHAASCPRCSAALAALAAVRVDLRSLPPPALPPAVAARLDETLAQLRTGRAAARVPPVSANAHHPHRPEPGGRLGGAPAPPAGRIDSGGRRPTAPVVDLADAAEHRRARALRILGRVAASVVVAAALVGVGTAVLQHTDDNGRLAQSNALPETAGGRGHGGVNPQDAPGAGSGDGRPAEGSAPPAASLPAYTEDTLLGAIPSITSRSAVDVITSAGLDGPAGPMADTERRARCAASIPGSNGIPVAVQRVLFEDQAAYVFVFTGTDGSRTVVVVGADCGASPVPEVLFRHEG